MHDGSGGENPPNLDEHVYIGCYATLHNTNFTANFAPDFN